MPPRRNRRSQLKDQLTIGIGSFSKEKESSIRTITNSLSELSQSGLLYPFDWTAYIRDIYRDKKLSTLDKDELFKAFVTFTNRHEVLRDFLKFVITNTKDNLGGPNGPNESDDDESDDEDALGDSRLDIGRSSGQKPKQMNVEADRTWQEWVGSKILEDTPSLITPEPLSSLVSAINVDESVLRLAVINEADWVFPSTISGLIPSDQTRIKALMQAGTPNDTLLETAVKRGNIKVIKNLIRMLKSAGIDQSERGGMLQLAITSRRADIAQLLVNEYPEIIEQTPNKLSALEVLRKTSPFPEQKALEEFLISKSVRRKTPSVVRRLLYDPNTQSSHLYADLSIFNDEIYDFDAFLSSLERYKVNFYSTLIYVKLPRLKNKEPNSNREEAFVVLNWLRTRAVRTILELHVPDAIEGPHSDEGIEKWLGLEPGKDGFKNIETLNWERLDLSLETLKVVRGLQKVYLYTENWNTLAFWTGPEGLCSKDYENITEATIVVVQDHSITRVWAESYRYRAIKRLERYIPEREQRITQEGREFQTLVVKVKVAKWDSGEYGSGYPDTHPSNTVTPRQVTDLDPFLKQDPRSTFPAQQMPSANIWPRPTRVAIIDNGVDAGITKIWDRVAESQSFVEFNETRESTVWLASHPHGTQMASIVIDIDPRCLLYIAKVGIGAHDFVSADNIIAAIDWAAAFEVDIVVISMVLKPDPRLAEAVRCAHNDGKGPVFFCATEDKGNAGDEVYPAYLPQTIAIAACDRGGKEFTTTDPNAQYYFQGHQIQTDCLSYGACKTAEPTGSSIATAIAAGVASLILSCRFLADLEGHSHKTKLDTIKAVFKDMIDDTSSNKYVSPGRFFKERRVDDVPWTTEDWKRWIHSTFEPERRYA